MAKKKKVQRTDWKKEYVLLQQDRNNHIEECERIDKELAREVGRLHDTQVDVGRLEREQREVSNTIENVVTIAEMMTSAPAHSIPGDGVEGYGRDVLLGMLLEKLRTIPRPVPF